MTQITSLTFGVNGFVESLQGGRPENQDDWGCVETPLGFLLVVCDGMGGGPGGKTASYTVKNIVMHTVFECGMQAPREAALKLAVTKAQEAIEKKIQDVPALSGMGSTLVAILINQDSALIAHLGDSRCYRIHNGRIAFRTEDHSLVAELVKGNALTEEQARVSPQSNVITRGIGSMSNHVPEIDEVPFCRGDRFVLCTDGVWGIMPHKDLVSRLTDNKLGLASIVNNLSYEIDQIGNSGGGGHDNHTLAIIEINVDSILKDKMTEKIKLLIGALSTLLFVSIIINFVMMTGAKEKPFNQENLAKAYAEIERLKPYENRYRELLTLNGNNSALNSLIQSLSTENDSLRMHIMALELKRDTMSKKNEPRVDAKSTNYKPITEKKALEKDYGVHSIIKRVLSHFDSLRDANGKDLGQLQQTKNEIRNSIVQLLNQLNEKTNNAYEPTISALKRQLKDGTVPMKIDKADKDGVYRSTMAAKKEIEKLKQKVSDIRNKIK